MTDPNSTTFIQKIASSSVGALLTSLVDRQGNGLRSRVLHLAALLVSCSSVTPFDVVKVRLQAQTRVKSGHKCFLYHTGIMDHLCICANGSSSGQFNGSCWYNKPPPPKFRGTFDALIKLARHEGVASLWSGLPPTLIMSIPATVCYFTVYDSSKAVLQAKFGSSLAVPMLAGVFARTLVLTAVSPLEVVRTKVQSERINYTDISRAIRTTAAQEGSTILRILYRGWTATFLRDVPFSAIYWVTYEWAKSTFSRFKSLAKPNLEDLALWMASGSLAGAVASLCTVPFDVVKTNQQIEFGDRDALRDYKKKPHSFVYVFREVYRSHGMRGLFAGTLPRLLKVAPACAIMIGTYEYGKAYFNLKNAAGSRVESNG